ncbi:MAG: LacI family DNA-binding transcriptional regulator [bacterium]
MRVSLKDIAEKANVSISTVSRALNGEEIIKKETRNKIQKIAQEMNYVPNYRAQSLVNKSTKTVGVLVPKLENEYFIEVTENIRDELAKHGYRIILCATGGNVDIEREHIRAFRGGQVDAAILIWCTSANKEIVVELAENIPVVFIGNGHFNEKISIVRSNLKKGTYELTNYLISLGHNDIGYIGIGNLESAENSRINVFDERLAGFQKAMVENNIPIKDKYMILGGYDTYQQGFERGSDILKLNKLPTAVVCMNDEVAIGLLQYFAKSGIEVPADVSVVGIDDIKVSEFYTPALTTLRIEKNKIGKKAGQIIIEHTENTNESIDNFTFNTEMIKRDSVQEPRDKDILNFS